jgi:hypothetical protein
MIYYGDIIMGWECNMHGRDDKTKKKKKNSVALVRKRAIPTERLPLVDEVSVNFCK